MFQSGTGERFAQKERFVGKTSKLDAFQGDGRVQEERGDGMTRLTTLISFCLGAIITKSMRRQDYFILTFALIAFVANIAVVYLIER